MISYEVTPVTPVCVSSAQRTLHFINVQRLTSLVPLTRSVVTPDYNATVQLISDAVYIYIYIYIYI